MWWEYQSETRHLVASAWLITLAIVLGQSYHLPISYLYFSFVVEDERNFLFIFGFQNDATLSAPLSQGQDDSIKVLNATSPSPPVSHLNSLYDLSTVEMMSYIK